MNQKRCQEDLTLELTKPGNQRCADCNTPKPTWASYNLGIFLCMICAGLHRNLGTHISRVKSVNLDNWKKDEVENMKTVGNQKSNQIYQYQLAQNYIKKDQADFIKHKYVKKEWMQPGVKPNTYTYRPPEQTASQDEKSYPTKYTYQISQLNKMGFTDNAENVKVLDRAKGDLSSTTMYLSGSMSRNSANQGSKFETQLDQLEAMGFSNKVENLRALEMRNGDVAAAIEILTGQPAPAPSPVTPVQNTYDNNFQTQQSKPRQPSIDDLFSAEIAPTLERPQPNSGDIVSTASYNNAPYVNQTNPQPLIQTEMNAPSQFQQPSPQPTQNSAKTNIMSLFDDLSTDNSSNNTVGPNQNPYTFFPPTQNAPMGGQMSMNQYQSNPMTMDQGASNGMYSQQQYQRFPQQPQMQQYDNNNGNYMTYGNPMMNNADGYLPQQQQQMMNPMNSQGGYMSNGNNNNNSATNPFL